MINFNTYNEKRNDMKISDLEVGQTLYRLVEDKYGHNVSMVVEYKITKILKTRLVLESSDGKEVRLLVENSKYSTYRNGEVSTSREGNSNSYNRTVYKFADVEDKGMLEKMVARKDDEIQIVKNKSAARTAVAGYKDYDLESIELAIQTLQVLAEDVRASKAE